VGWLKPNMVVVRRKCQELSPPHVQLSDIDSLTHHVNGGVTNSGRANEQDRPATPGTPLDRALRDVTLILHLVPTAQY
jgi:hypothetical protein